MILFLIIFVLLFGITALGVGFMQAAAVSRQKHQLTVMLKRAESTAESRRMELLKPEAAEDPFRKRFDHLALVGKVTALIRQAGLNWTTYKLFFLMLLGGVLGAIAGRALAPRAIAQYTPAICGALAAYLPLKIVLRKRAKRMAQFEEQFPEALDFLSRSMRAGHAFSIGLEMLVADASEPLRSCFLPVLNDMRLGSSLETALGKLVAEIPLIDVRFFVSAVLLQQGTGGNLSEVLDSMANIIRDRFRLKGHIKAVSAHGRITGAVLAFMPVFVAFAMFFMTPAYLLILFQEPDGRKMLIGAVVGQLIGYMCIRKIIDIRI